MADFIESARAILSQSERRIEATANNVANLTTSGFKRQRLYSDVSLAPSGIASEILLKQSLDLEQGRLVKTGNTLDLAISGPGMFQLRASDGTIAYSRGGQFKLASDGRVLNGQGLALQAGDGGDLVLPGSDISVLADGTILEAERPIGKLALYQAADSSAVRPVGGSLFAIADEAVEEVADPQLRQGMIEASNVTLADEMVSMMEALRTAEGGARLVQSYDDLMGKAISAFGQGGR